jgi:elongation factor Ts
VSISAQDVKVLREKTGAGIMECKKALTESDGDIEKAIKSLREKGLAEAKKRSGREAKEGIITVAYSNDGNEVSMVELNCETDFVSRTDKYKDFVEETALLVLEQGLTDPENLSDEVKTKIKEAIASFGENIILRKIARFKKSDDKTSILHSYIHLGGKVGVIIELKADDAGIVKNDDLKEFIQNVVLQIASMDPISVSRDDVPSDVVEEQKEILSKQARDSGKPEKIIDKIVGGRLEKFFAQMCLLEQKYVKDSDMTVGKYLKQTEEKIEGKINIERFARFKLGEE